MNFDPEPPGVSDPVRRRWSRRQERPLPAARVGSPPRRCLNHRSTHGPPFPIQTPTCRRSIAPRDVIAPAPAFALRRCAAFAPEFEPGLNCAEPFGPNPRIRIGASCAAVVALLLLAVPAVPVRSHRDLRPDFGGTTNLSVAGTGWSFRDRMFTDARG